MAVVENNKPKTEKTSASVTLTLPRLRPETHIEFKNTNSNIPKLKSGLLKNRRVSNEKSERLGTAKTLPINFYKSKLLETTNAEQVRYLKNSSLDIISPTNYHSQIPLLKRHSLSALTMSPPVTRFSSPLKKNSPKEKQNKIKTISFEDNKKTTKVTCSRSPSPVKRERPPLNGKKQKPRPPSPTLRNVRNVEKTTKCGDALKLTSSPRINSPAKKKSKVKLPSPTNLELMKESMVRSAPAEEASLLVLKQCSQPSLSQSEKLIQPQEKFSLDHLKNEMYTGDYKRMSFEKVHLSIEKKEVESLGLGEKKRRYLLKYLSEDLRNENDISPALLKNLFSKDDSAHKLSEGDLKSVIRTLSGEELVLTASMKFHMDEGEIGSDDVEISKLLNETDGHFESQKDVQIPQDEASEYDSEVSTDGELARMSKSKQQLACRVASHKDMHRKSTSFWKSREAELLNDVDYRQSVYHPAVSRRQKDDVDDSESKKKSKSIENNFEIARKSTSTVIRSRSQTLKNSASEKMGSSSNERSRSWASTPFDTTDGKESYTNVLKNGPLYDVKRARTNKERVSGALLHFTLKIIRLLAIFNIWPGDNCYILTSHSLRFAR